MDKELSLEQMQSELQAMGERAVAASRELAVMSARNGRVHSSQLLFRKGFQA